MTISAWAVVATARTVIVIGVIIIIVVVVIIVVIVIVFVRVIASPAVIGWRLGVATNLCCLVDKSAVPPSLR